jgi:hypothetical protein
VRIFVFALSDSNLLWGPLISFVCFCSRYVINAAEAAKVDKDQRLIYLSVRVPLNIYRCIVVVQPRITIVSGGPGESPSLDILLAE